MKVVKLSQLINIKPIAEQSTHDVCTANIKGDEKTVHYFKKLKGLDPLQQKHRVIAEVMCGTVAKAMADEKTVVTPEYMIVVDDKTNEPIGILSSDAGQSDKCSDDISDKFALENPGFGIVWAMGYALANPDVETNIRHDSERGTYLNIDLGLGVVPYLNANGALTKAEATQRAVPGHCFALTVDGITHGLLKPHYVAANTDTGEEEFMGYLAHHAFGSLFLKTLKTHPKAKAAEITQVFTEVYQTFSRFTPYDVTTNPFAANSDPNSAYQIVIGTSAYLKTRSEALVQTLKNMSQQQFLAVMQAIVTAYEIPKPMPRPEARAVTTTRGVSPLVPLLPTKMGGTVPSLSLSLKTDAKGFENVTSFTQALVGLHRDPKHTQSEAALDAKASFRPIGAGERPRLMLTPRTKPIPVPGAAAGAGSANSKAYVPLFRRNQSATPMSSSDIGSDPMSASRSPISFVGSPASTTSDGSVTPVNGDAPTPKSGSGMSPAFG